MHVVYCELTEHVADTWAIGASGGGVGLRQRRGLAVVEVAEATVAQALGGARCSDTRHRWLDGGGAIHGSSVATLSGWAAAAADHGSSMCLHRGVEVTCLLLH